MTQGKNVKRIFIYKRFERFWHWCQAALIIFLTITGFEIHGTFTLFGFEHAVSFHRIAAYILVVLIAFAIFWHFTTDGWRHYIPTTKNFIAQVKFYMYGIFKGEDHPIARTELSKLNPLQRLVYLGLKLIIIPMLVISGLLYLYYSSLGGSIGFIEKIGLESIALWHTLGAFLMLSFLAVHIYMTTTGHTPLSNIKAMLTGYEEIESKEESEDKER